MCVLLIPFSPGPLHNNISSLVTYLGSTFVVSLPHFVMVYKIRACLKTVIRWSKSVPLVHVSFCIVWHSA